MVGTRFAFSFAGGSEIIGSHVSQAVIGRIPDMNRPLFGAVLARRLFDDVAGDNDGGEPFLRDDGVGGTGVSTASARTDGSVRQAAGMQVGKAACTEDLLQP